LKVPLSWLREFVEVPVEPPRLAEDLTRVGLAVDGLEGQADDPVLDLDITTNRVDCMNVYGVAREVAVLYDRPLRPLDLSLAETGPAAGETWSVEVESPDLCPRFCGRVLEVRMGPSPAWIRERLEKVGVRPISNVVDLTNYVMMEMGHPSHAFDLAKVPGGRMKIRWARAGERLTTLDGTERVLRPGIGLVAGEEAPLALAGIMGGARSEVSDQTRLVALEAAYWEPLAIRRAAKALGMHTEASHRFERAADPEGPPLALARIGHLLQKIGAGSVRPGLIDQYVARRGARSAVLRPARTNAVLGVSVPEEASRRILSGLGFAIGDREGEGFRAGIPTWRGDVSREIDLIEEVGRHHGLDKIPSTIPASRGAEGLRPWQVRERLVREVMVGAGLTEVINYAFVPGGAAGAGAAAVLNPLSEEQGVLRRSLVWPALARTLDTNQRQGRREVRVFEVGRVFALTGGRLAEERRLGLLITGAGQVPHWSDARPRREVDFFDAKGILELLARRLGRAPFRFTAGGVEESFVHPGRSAVVWDGEHRLGFLAALHPDWQSLREMKDVRETKSEVYVAEIALDALLEDSVVAARAQALPRFPAVARDLSVLWDGAAPAEALLALVRQAAGPLLQSAAVTDRYEGPPVPPGKVSLTLTLVFQDPARTLTAEDVQERVEAIMTELRQAGAEIRSE
jgi:phenylalanyl-tRNA synthetase beta chain